MDEYADWIYSELTDEELCGLLIAEPTDEELADACDTCEGAGCSTCDGSPLTDEEVATQAA